MTDMGKLTVMPIFGTRPEAIKMAPVIKALRRRRDISCVVCVTGQHRQMLDQVMKQFDIAPNIDLNIMKSGQTLAGITADVLIGLEKAMLEVKPTITLVHGDTTTALAAALASFYQKIPIGHIEAGLRTYDKYSPFPEEMNRQIVDQLSTLYFAPTPKSAENLRAMGAREQDIFVTGNTAIDALSLTVSSDFKHPALDWCRDSRMILLTMHRRESIGEPMRNVFRGLRRVMEKQPDVKVIYPVHMNPLVRAIAEQELGDCTQVCLSEPLDVLSFHNFMNRSYFIMTDSGGIQEEAPSLGKPVLVLRDVTERPEGIAAGTLRLIGTQEDSVFTHTMNLLNDRRLYEQMSKASNPYGDGHASERIVSAVAARCGSG